MQMSAQQKTVMMGCLNQGKVTTAAIKLTGVGVVLAQQRLVATVAPVAVVCA